MKGFVPTPDQVVDRMVSKLFSDGPPRSDSVVLDPGCGTGAFLKGIIRWCDLHHSSPPKVIGIESDPHHLPEAWRSIGHCDSVQILNEDFLAPRGGQYDFIIGNPPYVPITGLSDSERSSYRTRFTTATGRFDLYLLFFEQALRLLRPNGKLVFITPEKFLYVRSAGPLRRALGRMSVDEVHLFDETTFGDPVTYPTITSVANRPPGRHTRVIFRDGSSRDVRLPRDGSSWLPAINGTIAAQPGCTLADVSLRISCGVATGADAVYVVKTSQLPRGLERFAFPTVAGREIVIGRGMAVSHSMLIPYARTGELLGEAELGEFGVYLRQPEQRRRLLQRTCVAHKPWYAFHENPPLSHILRPKILCKDITPRPFFFVEEAGEVVPRYSVYYIVPHDPARVRDLCEYLTANGFLRLQSHVLKRVPVPAEFAVTPELCYGTEAAGF